MTEKGFFGKIGSMFSGGRGSEGETSPAGEPSAPDAGTERPRPESADRLLEALDRQARALETLHARLGKLPETLATLGETLQHHIEVTEGLSGALQRLSSDDDELSATLHAIDGSTRRQTEAIEAMRDALASGQFNRQELAGALGKLAETINNTTRSNAAHVDLIERIRDRLAAANEGLEETLARHARRLTWLIGALVGMLALLVLAILAHGLMAR